MKKRCVLYLFLVLILVTCMIPGCKNKNKKKGNDTEEKTEIIEQQEDTLLPEDEFEEIEQEDVNVPDSTEGTNTKKPSKNETDVKNTEQETEKDEEPSRDEPEDEKLPQDDPKDEEDSERKPIVLPGIKLEDS